MIIYILFCIFVFVLSLLTAIEDVIIMRRKEPSFAKPTRLQILGLFFLSFIPGLNVIWLVLTLMYRAGKL